MGTIKSHININHQNHIKSTSKFRFVEQLFCILFSILYHTHTRKVKQPSTLLRNGLLTIDSFFRGTKRKTHAFTWVFMHMVEAMGIEPMSESRFRSISTSVAFPFNSRLCTPKSRLTESVAQKTFSEYEQVRRMFTADRRLFRDRSPSRADGWGP